MNYEKDTIGEATPEARRMMEAAKASHYQNSGVTAVRVCLQGPGHRVAVWSIEDDGFVDVVSGEKIPLEQKTTPLFRSGNGNGRPITHGSVGPAWMSQHD